MSAGAGSRIRVLCVDDDPDFADVTAQMLGLRNERIDATAVDSAGAGLDALEDDTYDCIVSDYDMPGTNGLEFLSAVHETFPDLPFVLFTGKGSEDIASEAIRAGAEDYIQKGVGRERFDLLTKRVENAASRARNRRQRRVAERRYQQLFEQSVVAIGVSQDGVFRAANTRLAELFGYDQSEFVGLSVGDVIAPEDRDVVERALRRRERGEVDSIHYVVTGVRADGERMEVEVHGGRITYEGEPAVLGIVVPVADRSSVESPSGVNRIVTPEHERVAEEPADGTRSTEGGYSAEPDHSTDGEGSTDDHLTESDHRGEIDRTADSDTAVDTPTADSVDSPRPTRSEQRAVQGVASLQWACREAMSAVDPEGVATLTVVENGTYDVEQSVLTETVQCLFAAGVGDEPAGDTITVEPTEMGFRVRVESPTLRPRLDSDGVDGLGSQSPPITDVAKRRYWAVYTTSIDDTAVEYEVEGPSRLSTDATD